MSNLDPKKLYNTSIVLFVKMSVSRSDDDTCGVEITPINSFFMNKVTIDLNMIGPLMKGKVSNNKDTWLVIIMHRHIYWGCDV